MTNRIAFYYSIYSDDNIENSIVYLTRLAYNIKYYLANDLYEHFDLIINTDDFTQNILREIIHCERVDTMYFVNGVHRENHIIWRIFNRNSGSKGMFWRLNSFVDTSYDITINAEGDWPIQNYFKQLEFFKQRPDTAIMFRNMRQFEKNTSALDGGCIFIRPNLIPKECRDKFKDFIDLVDNLSYVMYGMDETFIKKFTVKNLKDVRIIFWLNKSTVKDNIVDEEHEIEVLNNLFTNCDVIHSQDMEKAMKDIKSPYKNEKVEQLKYLVELNGQKFYIFDKMFLKLKHAPGSRNNQFLEKKFF